MTASVVGRRKAEKCTAVNIFKSENNYFIAHYEVCTKSPEFKNLKISARKPITISKILQTWETLAERSLDFFNTGYFAGFHSKCL